MAAAPCTVRDLPMSARPVVLGWRKRLRVCFEACRTGYELARLVHSRGVACQVIALWLIPEQPAARSRPTAATAGGWPACIAPATWSPSASPPLAGGGRDLCPASAI
jgi:hypothetical protein